MSAPDGWVALDDASSAFERPSWAVRALLDQGKLERKVERGQVYVRFPSSPGAPPRATATVPEAEREPAAETARTLDELATELAQLLPDTPSSESTAIAPVADLARAPLASPGVSHAGFTADAALWSEVAANLADLAHAARARDALLARTVQALRAVEAATARASRQPEPSPRFPWALGAVLLALAVASAVFAHVEGTGASSARAEADLALSRATRLEARARREKAQTAALVLELAKTAFAPTASAPVALVGSSAATLPAAFAK